ncbi:hypothetical protein NPIL_608381 [Nephila pilipes]|uniref:Uncharacterized protein n=1 Tax=Nephila pilipes TaxID=299642 RepID=A0A8X6PTL3_NEPPI|nr:hypothetical protein NPIL_608381 [Nephila pilipes]
MLVEVKTLKSYEVIHSHEDLGVSERKSKEDQDKKYRYKSDKSVQFCKQGRAALCSPRTDSTIWCEVSAHQILDAIFEFKFLREAG